MSKPKILIFDIENFFKLENIFQWGSGFKADKGAMISFGYKWYGEPNVYAIHNTKKQLKKDLYDDSEIVERALKVMQQADLAVTHYGREGYRGHDKPYFNSRCLAHGLVPPTDLKIVDTQAIAKTRLRLSSNRLNDVASFLKCEHSKTKVSHALWPEAAAGNYESLKKLADYNMDDVVVLEEIYTKLRPLARGHVNMGLWNDSDAIVCPICASAKYTYQGIWPANSRVYRRRICSGCGKSYKGELKR